jgi:hypothetical protein
MIDRISFAHDLDPSIRATFRAPSRDAYAAFWDELCKTNGVPDHVALLNLTIACREEPDAIEFRTWLDEFWSGLPDTAGWMLYSMAGHFKVDVNGVPTRVDAKDVTGEMVDLRAALGDVNHIPEAERPAAATRAADHLLALDKFAGADVVRALMNAKRTWMTRVLVALPWGGYYVGRMPTSGDRMTASRIRRATADAAESGAYAAAVWLALDCAIWPDATVLSALFDRYPGAATKLGAIVNDIGGGAAAVESK